VSLEVSDHALGPLLHGAPEMPPDPIIGSGVDPPRQFVLRAGPGGFIYSLIAGEDVSLGGELLIRRDATFGFWAGRVCPTNRHGGARQEARGRS
jgi:hypothetical protein